MTETLNPMGDASQEMEGPRMPGVEKLRRKAGSEEQSGAAGARSGSKAKGGDEQQRLRRDLLRITRQFQQTQELIKSDRSRLEDLAENDERVAQVLEASDSKKIGQISDKILNNAAISQKDAQHLISTMKETTGNLQDLNRTFEVNLGSITGRFADMIRDQRIDTESRRRMAQNISQFVEDQGESADEVRQVLDDLPTSGDFDDHSDKVADALEKVSSRTDEVKTRTTLQQLNENMDNAALTNEQLTGVLEQQTRQGKSLQELFEDMPSFFSGGGGFSQGLGGGVVSSVLGSVGLETEDLLALGLFGGTAARGVGRFGRGAARGLSGLLGLLGMGGGRGRRIPGLPGGGKRGGGKGGPLGFLGRLLGRAGGLAKGVAGKFPLLALAFGAYDAVTGFGNAEGIAGLEEGEDASLRQKVRAATASFASGLSFGLVDEKTIFKGLESYRDTLQSIADTVSSTLGLDHLFADARSALEGAKERVLQKVEDIKGSLSFDNIAETVEDLWDSVLSRVRDISADAKSVLDSILGGFEAQAMPESPGNRFGIPGLPESAGEGSELDTSRGRPEMDRDEQGIPGVPENLGVESGTVEEAAEQAVGQDVRAAMDEQTAALLRESRRGREGQGAQPPQGAMAAPTQGGASRQPFIDDPQLILSQSLLDR